MPELGKNAVAVLGAFGATALLLGGLVALTWLRARVVRRRLEAAEERRR